MFSFDPSNKREVWRHVTMVATFLDHNKRELKQQREDRNENGKKAIGIN